VKNALLIGGAGFVGRHLAKALQANGFTTVVVDPALNHSFANARDSIRNVSWDLVAHLGANILDVDARAKAGVEVYSDLALDYQVCEFFARNPPACFLAMSSCAVDHVEDPYGWIKQTLERLCMRMPCRTVIVRPFSGYGVDQALSYPFPAILARALRREDPLVVWGGKQVRDWVHISDLVAGILHMVEHAPDKVPVQLGTGFGTSLADLASAIACAVGYVPRLHCATDRATGSLYRVADTALATSLGWRAKTDLASGIRMCIGS
jgi:nucleoside-diphosphate-sugar epimerase